MSTPSNTADNAAGDHSNGMGERMASPSRTTHLTQFSAATQMILDRLRASGGLLAPNSQLSLGNPLATGTAFPPGYEDVKRSVMEGYKTTMGSDVATTNIIKRVKTPASRNTASSTSTPARASVTPVPSVKPRGRPRGSTKGVNKAGGKRKRAKDESESDEESEPSKVEGESESEEEVMVLPSQTLSGRRIVKPTTFTPPAVSNAPPRKRAAARYNKKTGRNVEQALCKRCSRGNSPSTNQIVFCDSCNNGWHQNCHDPRITDDLVRDQSAQWFCKTCTEKKATRAAKRDKAKQAPPTKVPATAPPPKEPTPQPLPQPSALAIQQVSQQPIHVPLRSIPSGGWGTMTNGEKRQYLMQVPYEHLVSAFIHATNLYPSLPVMPQSSQSARPFNNSPTIFNNQQYQGLNNMRQGRPYQQQTHQQPFPPSAVQAINLFPRSTANPGATMNFIRKMPDGQNSHGSYNTSSMSLANNVYQSPHQLNQSNGTLPSMMDHPIFQNVLDVDMNLGRDVLSSQDPFGAEHGRTALHSLNNIQQDQNFFNDVVENGHDEEPQSESSRDSTPASPPYPRPGTGAMSKLRTDDEELDWLVGGSEDDVAFSHTILEAT